MSNWNRSTSEKPNQKDHRRGHLFLPAVAFVVGAVVVWWLFFFPTRNSSNASARSGGAISEYKATVRETTSSNSVSRIRFHQRPSVKQNATASIGRLPDKPIFENAPRYGEINGTNLFPRPLFKTREENHIAGLINAKPGSRCPLSGFMPGEEERFLKCLDVEVEFEERDTPDEREMKEYMIEVKKELKERVAAGEKITDIVQQARDDLNALANMRDKLIQKFMVLQKEGSVDDIMTFYKEGNEILAEYGLQPLALRSNKRELYETYLQQKKAEELAVQSDQNE